MVTIRHELAVDVPAREALLDRAFGEGRFRKTAERLREGRAAADGLSFIAEDDDCVVGTVRLWAVLAGGVRRALLLGPIAVDDARRGLGIGADLMRRATEAARGLGHAAVLLVGDAAYYDRFGFTAEKTRGLWLPGPFERHRLLARELVPGVLDGVCGPITPAGQPAKTSEAVRAAAAVSVHAAGAARAA